MQNEEQNIEKPQGNGVLPCVIYMRLGCHDLVSYDGGLSYEYVDSEKKIK